MWSYLIYHPSNQNRKETGVDFIEIFLNLEELSTYNHKKFHMCSDFIALFQEWSNLRKSNHDACAGRKYQINTCALKLKFINGNQWRCQDFSGWGDASAT